MSKRLMTWLPVADAAVSANLAGAVTRETSGVADLSRLAQFEWDSGGLRRLARAVRKVDEDDRSSLQPVHLLLFSNGTAAHLADTLVGTGLRHGLFVTTMIVEYEDPQAYLARETEALRAFGPDVVVLGLDVHAFGARTALGDISAAESFAAAAAQRIEMLRQAVKSSLGVPVICQTLAPDPAESRLHVDSLVPGSYGDVIARTNRKIADGALSRGDLVLNVAGLALDVGLSTWFSPRYWAMAKYPVAPEVEPLYAEHLIRLVALRRGKSRRVLVLDLDNTLWGGVVGDDGKENLVLGPGTPVGEAHHAVQRFAKSVRDRGIVVCVSSKNEEAIALDAFRTHPEMLLKEDDVAMMQINWTDKPTNIRALALGLNLGLDSFVFVDDNPVERAIVREALPEVAVPELPRDVTEWLPVLQSARYFESVGFTAEDRSRADYYRANAMRASQLGRYEGHDDYLRSLGTELDIRPFDRAGRTRIAQLIAKSNQFNLTTTRYSEAEVAQFEDDPTTITAQVRLRDVFGDSGMISVIIAHDHGGDDLEIGTWLMSCRVLGRRVQEAVLDWLAEHARTAGKTGLLGSYLPTAKNALVVDHYRDLGFSLVSASDDGATTWRLDLSSYESSNPPIRVTTAHAVLENLSS